MSSKRIYLDNAATTPIDSRVLKEFEYHLKNTAGNPGAISKEGVEAKKVLEGARKSVAGFLEARPDEIVFTSGGTESNNAAIFGVRSRFSVLGSQPKKFHAITTAIEHSSVLECFRELEKRGMVVTYLPVDEEGIVDLQELKKALRPETVLVSIQYANNEIGVVQPIREISKLIRGFRRSHSSLVPNHHPLVPIFHTDASQAACYLDCCVNRLGVDLLTLDAQKVYGPKGIGALYVRRGTLVRPLLKGGGQEKGLRPGTENAPAAAALAKALEICKAEREKESARLTKLRGRVHFNILQNVGMSSMIISNGNMTERLPNNLNFSFEGVDTEFLVLQLDAQGISVSTKSSCTSSAESSHVVAALAGPAWAKDHTLRISMGRFTKSADVSVFLKVLERLLAKRPVTATVSKV